MCDCILTEKQHAVLWLGLKAGYFFANTMVAWFCALAQETDFDRTDFMVCHKISITLLCKNPAETE